MTKIILLLYPIEVIFEIKQTNVMGNEPYSHIRPWKKRPFIRVVRLRSEVDMPRETGNSDYQKVSQFPLRSGGMVRIEVPYFVRNNELNLHEYEIF